MAIECIDDAGLFTASLEALAAPWSRLAEEEEEEMLASERCDCPETALIAEH